MKIKITLVLMLFSFTILLFGQTNESNDIHKPFFKGVSQDMKIIPPLLGRELIPVDNTKKEYRDKPWLNFPTNFNALPKGEDPLFNKNKTYKIPGNPPIESFVGATVNQGSGFPPDPTGAVGPNHYIHSYNTGFVIFDKQGTVLIPHNSLANIFPGETLGDPIVLYDRYADRFLITEFSNSPNGFLMAVSLGPDPTTSGWATYRFSVDTFPDYPKFSIWHDGYYITANKRQGNAVYVAERDAMIAGETNAQMLGFNLPGVVQNNTTIYSPLPINSIGPNLPDASTPGFITYLQDDSWGAGPDHLKIWEITIDWEGSSNISSPLQISTTPFDSFLANFGTGEVPQPGVTGLLDGQSGIVSYMCNYWAFDDHNSVTLNFNVDVSGNNSRIGIRWYELRENDGNWTIEQEGTFSPDDDIYRFMGSMSMDTFGNIGLAYSRGNATNFTSLYFTGRFANDPLGQMTIDEEPIILGTGSQNFRRYGDYAQLTLDPLNNKTFWFTSEYFVSNGGWRTRIASFQIAPLTTNDVGVIAINQPIDATFTNSETVTVTLFNFGENTQSNIPVSLSVDGTVVANEIFNGSISPTNSVEFTFAQTVDLSILGQTYLISSTTNLSGDEDNQNDEFSKEVTHLDPNDLGVTDIIAPTSNTDLGNETITVEITNFGGEPRSNFNVSYSIDNNTPVVENVPNTVNVDDTITYSFSTQGDFSTQGIYNLSAKTLLVNDIDASNDETSVTVRNIDCIPAALPQGNEQGCNLDGIKRFILGSINADNGANGCNTEGGSGVLGYADRTNLSTDLDRSLNTSFVRVQQNWDAGINGPEKISMWIDFNDNGLFEVSEQMITAEIFDTDNVLETFTFHIPDDANIGSHILRVRVIDTSSTPGDPNDPCADYHFGETQDYTVNIIDGTLSQEDLFFNETTMTIATLENNQFQVELPTTLINETLVITLHNMLGQKFVNNRVENVNGSYSYTLNLDGLSSGVYLVRLGTSKFGKVKRIIVK
jgi:hypothetical protein